MNKASLSISLHHLSFPLSVFISLQSIGLFSPWLNLFPCILFFFDVILNEIVFLLYPPDCSLLMYGKAKDSYVLILYSVTLLNSFITSNSF